MTDQPALDVEALAQLMSAADVHVNHGNYPTWETLSTEPGYGRDEYRKAARYVLARTTVTARQTTGQADTGPTCAHCQGTGADPEDQGDYDPNVHMYNPTTIGPCPECHGTGKDAPAVGQPAEAQDADRAALRERLRLAIAQQYLDDTGSGRTVDELDDTEFGSLADAALRALTVEDER